MPIMWPIIGLKISPWEPISSHLRNQISRPWDFKFGNTKPAWITVHLKDGRKIGRIFDHESYASSYPAEEQLYLETVWKLDKNGNFEKEIKR
jgi:Family of unknown function (DUF6338)